MLTGSLSEKGNIMVGPFSAGQRVKVTWAGDNSVLEGNLSELEFENKDDLVIGWGNQMVHFWDGVKGTMTYIFGLDDVTIEILDQATS